MFNFLLLFNNVSLIVTKFGCIFSKIACNENSFETNPRIFVCRIFQLSHLLKPPCSFVLNLLLLLSTVFDFFTSGFLADRDGLAQVTIVWDVLAPVLCPLGAWGSHILKNGQAGLVSEGHMGVYACKHHHRSKHHTSPNHSRHRRGACARRRTPRGRSLACYATDMSS